MIRIIAIAILIALGFHDHHWILFLLAPLVTSVALCQMGKSGLNWYNGSIMYLFSGTVASVVGIITWFIFRLVSDGYPVTQAYIAYIGLLAVMVGTQDQVPQSQKVEP